MNVLFLLSHHKKMKRKIEMEFDYKLISASDFINESIRFDNIWDLIVVSNINLGKFWLFL